MKDRTNTMWTFICNYLKVNSSSMISDSVVSKSYKDVYEIVDNMGKKLKETIPTRSKCAILCDREFNTMLAVLSCWRAGCVPIILSKNYGINHSKKIIAKSCPDIFITDNDIICDELIPASDFPIFSITRGEMTGVTCHIKVEVSLIDIALIMFTSGTTGYPKGTMITEKGLIANVNDISGYFNINSKDKILIARPLYHSGVFTGELLVSLLKGVNIHFLDQKYNPLLIIKELENQEITVFGGTPTLLHHLVLFIKRMSKRLQIRVISISGECLSGEVAKGIRSVFQSTIIYHVYGLTEAAPRVSFLSPDLFDKYPESVGLPLSSVEVRIVDNSGNTLGPNIDGNLLVKGPNVMKGYYEDSSDDSIRDGWLWTKDIACRNNDGLIFIKSRADEMIIKGGMNIYPREIEQVLLKNWEIRDIIAYGIRKKEGMRIGINVVLSENVQLDQREIMSICSNTLPLHLLPDEINVVEHIEKNASGKTVRPKYINK
ncbi:class I adenylate-forming enzyme family protein [Paenibacillus motobuensis]|uniref:AMP-dependent synthetase/ligase domain-containing protein n=1 Tax=Paenibacillus motobuensis TaxID=295324 RepID=A0ABN0Y5C5_9BACL